MNYSEAIQFLHGLQLFGANFGLQTTRRLAAAAGQPQDKLRFIHVAGTNGKGSVCAMLESVYRAAGLRVGLFTSPHLVSFRERMQVNRQLISEADVARLVAEVERGSATRSTAKAEDALKLSEALSEAECCGSQNRAPAGRLESRPTFFEFITVLALKYFAEQKCDLVIWETGLGGRLDATNIVTPLASVITNIALDHQQWLGDTLARIAAEKAGIIKPGVPVVTGAEQPEALAVIESVARENGAALVKSWEGRRAAVPNQKFGSPTWRPSQISLLGEHQQQNAALALATVETLQNQLPVTAAQIRDGLANVRWAGRLQLIERGAQTFLLDGAHNVAGAETLRAALLHWEGRRAAVPEQNLGSPTWRPSRITLILGVLGDKDWSPMCDILAPLAARIVTVPVASPRSAPAVELAAACRQANPAARAAAADSLAAALRATAGESFVVVAGSLYLVGEALELLDPAFAPSAGERGLNEWRAGLSPDR